MKHVAVRNFKRAVAKDIAALETQNTERDPGAGEHQGQAQNQRAKAGLVHHRVAVLRRYWGTGPSSSSSGRLNFTT